MRWLVQRIDGEARLQAGDGPRKIAVSLCRGGEVRERVAEARTQGVGFGGLPVIELRAVAEGEAREEVPAVEGDRLLESALAKRAAELEDVDEHVRSVEVNGLPVGKEPAVPERAPEHRQGPTERAAGLLLVRLGPQQRREDAAPLRLLGHGQVGKERGRLTGVGDNDGAAGDGARRAEEEYAKLGHWHLRWP